MKKIILSLMALAMISSCSTTRTATSEAASTAQEMTGQANYKFATAALRKGMFALTATRVDMGIMGMAEFGLNDRTNFVYQQGGEGVAQVAFNNADPGFNGLGGFTCRGRVNGTKFSTDKKGNAHYDFTINGDGITVEVNVFVFAGSNKAMATVTPTFGSMASSVTLHGDLVPYRQGN